MLVELPKLSPLQLPPRLLVFDSAEEQQSYEFFRAHSIKELTELFHVDESFWESSILQMSMTSPVVRYAVTALGAMHRKYIEANKGTAVPVDSNDPQMKFALEQSNRSIKTLLETRDLDARPQKVSTLMACILYTCLASIQGLQTQSIMHFRSGMDLLDGLSHNHDTDKAWENNYDSQFQSFLTTLSSLEVQARSLLCDENLSPWPTRTKIRPSTLRNPRFTFKNLAEARDFFESDMSDLQWFVIEAEADKEWIPIPGVVRPRRASEVEFELLVKKHFAGVRALEELIVRKKDLTQRDERMIAVLRLTCCTLEMYMEVYRTSPQYGELAWDRLDEYYQEIISISRQILACTERNLDRIIASASEVEEFEIGGSPASQAGNSTKKKIPRVPPVSSLLRKGPAIPQQRRPVFAFSNGMTGPLSTTAFACRNPKLRREALALLLLYPRREGLWDSHTAGRIDWEIMCIEEELSRKWHEERGRRGFEVTCAKDIPVECRIRTVDMVSSGARIGKIRFNSVKENNEGKVGKIVKIFEW
jgi:hypothetical protein